MQSMTISLIWSLLLVSFIKGSFASQTAAQFPKEYFQTCTEDDLNVLPKYNLGNYAYIIAVLVLANASAAFVRTRFHKQKCQQKNISYCSLVISLYWEVAMAALFAIILHHQQTYFQTLGRVSMAYPIINLAWTLYSVDKGNISTLEKIASLLFQLITIASFWVKVYLPFRIIFTSFSLVPLIQTIYRKYNRNAEKWGKVSSYQTINIICYQSVIIFFPTVVMDPYIWRYFIIQTIWGAALNLILSFPMLTGMYYTIKKCRLSLQRWLDKRNSRLLPNSQVCAICLEEMDAYAVVEDAFQQLQICFAGKSSLVRTSCGHTFHSICMKKWMKTYNWSCPIDYKEIPFQLK